MANKGHARHVNPDPRVEEKPTTMKIVAGTMGVIATTHTPVRRAHNRAKGINATPRAKTAWVVIPKIHPKCGWVSKDDGQGTQQWQNTAETCVIQTTAP